LAGLAERSAASRGEPGGGVNVLTVFHANRSPKAFLICPYKNIS
jgi:hypothetical protein